LRAEAPRSTDPCGSSAGLLTASLCPYAGQGAEVLQSFSRYLVKVAGNKRGLGTRASSLQALGICELFYLVVTPVFCILCFSFGGGSVPARTLYYTEPILLCQGDLAQFWGNFAFSVSRLLVLISGPFSGRKDYYTDCGRGCQGRFEADSDKMSLDHNETLEVDKRQILEPRRQIRGLRSRLGAETAPASCTGERELRGGDLYIIDLGQS
jgi:hypothetical protein